MHVCVRRRQNRGNIISVKAFRLSLDPGLTWLVTGWSTEQAHSIRLKDERRVSAERFVGTDVQLSPEDQVGLFKDPAGVSTYRIPSFQWPASLLHHLASVCRRCRDMTATFVHAPHDLPVVLWTNDTKTTVWHIHIEFTVSLVAVD